MNHTIVFLASLADVWNQRGKRIRQSSSKSYGPIVNRATDEQSAIVDIVYALKVSGVDGSGVDDDACHRLGSFRRDRCVPS